MSNNTARRRLLKLPLLTGFCLTVNVLASNVLADEQKPGTNVENPDAHQQWRCRAGSDGGWECTQISAPGPTYQKPERLAPTRTASAAPADEPRVQVVRNLDWVDEAALTPEQQRDLEPGCCGTYIEPPRDYEDADLDPEQASLRASATNTEAQGNVATFTGDVQVSQGFRQVRSDLAVVDRDQRTVELSGNVQFREPGLLMLGDRMQVNMDTDEVEIDDATFVMHAQGARGKAGRFRRDTEDQIYIDNAEYTTCEPGNNAWQLVASRVQINPDTGMATTRHARVKVKNVPVLYMPWLRYPIDNRRATGLLFPEFNIGDENGVDYGQPIYLNLAPNYDATVTPRYVQERGEMVELELRHLSRLTESTLGGTYLPDDDGGDDSDEDFPGRQSFAGQDRWLVNADHTGGYGKAWRTHVNYTKVSDEEYFRDLGSTTLQASSTTHLLQLGEVSYHLKNWRAGIKGVEYQTLINNTQRQYQQLPRVDVDGSYRFRPAGLDLELDLGHHYTVFDHDDPTRIVGDRLRADYALTLDKRWLWGYVRPTVKVKHVSYNLDDPVTPGADDNPSVTVPVGIFDAGLFFERPTTLLKGNIQTFEPRIYFLYSDFEEQAEHPNFDTSSLTFSYQQLFRDDRFSGGDLIGDAEQVTIGFTSRLLDAATGIEKLRASIGQIFYLEDRYVSLDRSLTKSLLESLGDPSALGSQAQRDIAADLLSDDSNIGAEFAVFAGEHWRLLSDVLYDDDSEKIDKGSFSLRYNNERSAIFNLGYRYTRRNPRTFAGRIFDTHIEQGDISTILPLSSSWSLIGRWNHDFTNSRELEVFGGVQYRSCCWSTSVIVRRWLDRDDDLFIPEEELEYDEGIFFVIQLKGLAGTGASVESILRDGIYGYDQLSR